jgi:Na+/H+ antiporter NhaC
LAGIFLSETLQAAFNPLTGALDTLERIAAVFGDAGNARILIFCLLIGALLALVRDSGGVAAFVERLTRARLTHTRRQVSLLSALLGSAIFIETNISVLTTGTFSRSLYDRFGMSRERLAYVLDSTCAPVSVLALINAWGAYVLGLISIYGLDNPVSVLVWSVPLNFYALVTLAGVYYTVIADRVHGPLRAFDARAEAIEAPATGDGRSRDMVLPLAVLVLGMVGFMAYTGDGNPLQGSGSKSVLWSTALAVGVSWMLLLSGGRHQVAELQRISFSGMAELLPLVVILLLSMAIGNSLNALGTGPWLASLIGGVLPPLLVAPLLFLIAGAISFSTGTSWGTFAIMIPIGLPLAFALDVNPSLALAAILGGGVFGDHCSPISDTTVVSSLAAGCDHIDHVRTQLPYALAAGAVTIVGYLMVGMFV